MKTTPIASLYRKASYDRSNSWTSAKSSRSAYSHIWSSCQQRGTNSTGNSARCNRKKFVHFPNSQASGRSEGGEQDFRQETRADHSVHSAVSCDAEEKYWFGVCCRPVSGWAKCMGNYTSPKWQDSPLHDVRDNVPLEGPREKALPQCTDGRDWMPKFTRKL